MDDAEASIVLLRERDSNLMTGELHAATWSWTVATCGGFEAVCASRARASV